MLVSVIYRSSHVSFVKDSDLIDKLRDFCPCYNRKIIMGDLHADLFKDGNDAKLVRNLAAELSLQIAQHGATHHTRTSHNWIDQILVDENDTIQEAHHIPANFRSRHNIIDICFQWGGQPLYVTERKYRNYKGISPSQMDGILSVCDWSSCTNSTYDPETALTCICDNLTAAIEQLAPVKTFTPKKGQLPWINAELAGMQRKQDATYKRYKRTGTSTFLMNFWQYDRR